MLARGIWKLEIRCLTLDDGCSIAPVDLFLLTLEFDNRDLISKKGLVNKSLGKDVMFKFWQEKNR